MAVATDSGRVTRRRAETRQRLIDAARLVFADEGFGRSTVEQVCDRAGYTRGAFYSNFNSLDELFLEMWAHESARMLADVQSAIERPGARDALASGEPAAVVAHVLEAIPVDAAWYRITAEFSAHALRNPTLRRVVAEREASIAATIMPIIQTALEATGRTVADPQGLAAALVAVHDGTSVQCLMTPDDRLVWQRRHDLFVRVVDSFLTPAPDHQKDDHAQH